MAEAAMVGAREVSKGVAAAERAEAGKGGVRAEAEMAEEAREVEANLASVEGAGEAVDGLVPVAKVEIWEVDLAMRAEAVEYPVKVASAAAVRAQGTTVVARAEA